MVWICHHKGYAADKCRGAAAARGVESALLNLEAMFMSSAANPMVLPMNRDSGSLR